MSTSPAAPEADLLGTLAPVNQRETVHNNEGCPGCGARVRLGGVTCFKCWPKVPEGLRDAWLRADGFTADDKSTRAIFRHFEAKLAQVQFRRNFPVLTQGPDVEGLLKASPYFHADERFGGRKIECPGCLGLMAQDSFVCPLCVKARMGLLDRVLCAPTLAAREDEWTALLKALRHLAGQPETDLLTFADLRGYDPRNGVAI